MRIISLLPAATEIVCQLGLGDELVGISHECDHPAELLGDLPRLTRSRLDPDASLAQIDVQVKTRAAAALSLYDVDSAQLTALAPDLVITQAQCAVCAVSEADVREALPSGAALLSLQPSMLADIWRDHRAVAAACGIDPDPAVRALRKAMLSLQIRTAAVERQSVLLLEWTDPLMGAGNWLPELVELTGGDLLLAEKGSHSRWISPEDVTAADPDVLIIANCGLSLDANRVAWRALARQPWVGKLRAVKRGKVFAVDGNAYFHRPGPRLVESAQILAELLHRDARLNFGHENNGWARVA
jgi:iron complex transport system substrate-binding protein